MLVLRRLLSYEPLLSPRLATVEHRQRRYRRIALLLVLLAVLNGFDLCCTLLAYKLGMLREMNPVAGAFLLTGLTPSFICYKLVLMIAGSTMLWKLRSSGWTLPACCLLVGAYLGLAMVWYAWIQEVRPILEM